MRRIVILVVGLCIGGCVKGTPEGFGDGDDDGPDHLVLDGGRYTVPGCGFDVVTLEGAEAPTVGAALGPSPDPYQIHLGFGGDPSTTMALLWRTDLETSVSQVRFGTASPDQNAEGVSYRYVAAIGGATVRVHEAHLCGLQPDTEYTYQVGGAVDGVESWSTPHTFRTAPVAADAEVKIAFVGDSRGGYDVWGQLADQITAQGVDLIMFSGDAVTFGNIQDEWETFFSAAPELLASVPMVSAHGNHDLNSVNYYSLFAMPGDEANYAYDYGAAHMTVVNDSPLNVGDLSGSIKTFLDQDLAAATRPWKIVNHHIPMFSVGTSHGSDMALRAEWQPVIDARHADLVLNGHDHIYMRSKPLYGDEVRTDTSASTVYVVSGGAGATLYGVDTAFFVEVAESTHSFGIVSVRANQLTMDSYRPGEDTPFDSFTLTKP